MVPNGATHHILPLQIDVFENWRLHLLNEYRRKHYAVVAIPPEHVYRALLYPQYVCLFFHYLFLVRQVRFQRHLNGCFRDLFFKLFLLSCKQVRKSVGLLRKFQNVLPRPFNLFVRPHYDHGDVIHDQT